MYAIRPSFYLSAVALMVAVPLAGCPSKATPNAVRPTAAAVVASSAAPKSDAGKVGIITGILNVPTPLLGAYAGAKIVAAGGGNFVGHNGAALNASTASLTRGLLSIPGSPLSGVKIYLADAGGSPIPGISSVQTDDKGNYTIPDVPAGYTFVVAADVPTTEGKTATYQTLVKSSELGATANVDAASTLVTAGVVQGLKGGDLGDFNPGTFQTARQTTDDNLTSDKLPDFTSRADVTAKIDALEAQIQALQQSIDEIKQDLADIKATLADIEKQLAERPSPPPPPGGPQQGPPGGPQQGPPGGPRQGPPGGPQQGPPGGPQQGPPGGPQQGGGTGFQGHPCPPSDAPPPGPNMPYPYGCPGYKTSPTDPTIMPAAGSSQPAAAPSASGAASPAG